MNLAHLQTSFSLSHSLATLAVESLIDEVNLTPKPALVDRRGSGAHTDLTLPLMEQSARSLFPMFEAMALEAMQASCIDRDLREKVGEIGRNGEQQMLLVTHGINTHRGAIWAMGLSVTASAFVIHNNDCISAREICEIVAEIAQIEDRFIPQQKLSHGQQVQKKYGVQGAKYQAQMGFPVVMNQGLPQLYRSRAYGMREQFAQLDAFFAMMAELEDTCVLYRSGELGLKRMQAGAQQILDVGGSSSLAGRRKLNELEADLLKIKASAGGVADLLAVTLFLDRVAQNYQQ
ncbi:triphosphoribosyl-dephospho-CoA synthase [Acinetobacter stercoris]|uniref:Probable 2-(5''-triphosphoribosyl)-3'-dephosphocoenzyme-A synthase n=1 Tax=Acinetobacter stercoris TaxID=2126983 RepID=A0A2U3N0D5_9GAMM|nr:triphosphoribosyl-dephospho-CoA synthase [Acinetobacter stercoris]SPL71128.1 2-(5''-triphosphoribosyl)-3'-dephosphocoenzyme-A synthase [Acinetobacter stercoris]